MIRRYLLIVFVILNGVNDSMLAMERQPLYLTVEYAYSLRANGKGWVEKNGAINWRQEDTVSCTNTDNGLLFSLFDGHGGGKISTHFKDTFNTYFAQATGSTENKLKQAFVQADQKLPSGENGDVIYDLQGSTGLAAFIETKENQSPTVTLGWVGDSRAVLEGKRKVDYETQDHSYLNEAERDRIKKTGGNFKFQNDSWRVGDTGLEVTRTLGDKEFRGELVIPTPEIKSIILSPDNKFIILASDGVWSSINSQDAVTIVGEAMGMSVEQLKDKYPDNPIVSYGTLQNKTDVVEEFASNSSDNLALVARALRDEAVMHGSKDNIAVIIVKLLWNAEKKPLIGGKTEEGKSGWYSWLQERKHLLGYSAIAAILGGLLYYKYKN